MTTGAALFYAARVDQRQESGAAGGNKLDDVPLDQRYCNNCDQQILDEGNIGDLWWDDNAAAGPCVVILCRTCA